MGDSLSPVKYSVDNLSVAIFEQKWGCAKCDGRNSKSKGNCPETYSNRNRVVPSVTALALVNLGGVVAGFGFVNRRW